MTSPSCRRADDDAAAQAYLTEIIHLEDQLAASTDGAASDDESDAS